MPVRLGVDAAAEKAAGTWLCRGAPSRSARTADRTHGCRACSQTASDRRRCCPCGRSTTVTKPLLARFSREMAHQVAIARIAVRDDDERKGAGCRERRGIAHRLAVQRRRDRRIARDGAIVAAGFLTGGQRGRIPDLERQRPVIAGSRTAWLCVEDVGPIPVRCGDGADADVVASRSWPARARLE